MKKKLIVFIFLFILFVLSSCTKKQEIICDDTIELYLGQEKVIDVMLTNNKNDEEFVFTPGDDTIVQMVDNKLITLKEGETFICVSVKDNPDIPAKNIDVKVVVEEIVLEGEASCYVGQTVKIIPEYQYLKREEQWQSSDEDCACVEDGYVYAKKEGNVTITFSISGVSVDFNIEIIKDEVLPTIQYKTEEKIVEINWNENFDFSKIFSANDNIDGDISTKLVTVGFNNKEYGEQDITVKAIDTSGNEASLPLKVKVVWNYSVQFIGHSGSYYGIANTEEAFIYAADVLKYQILECDLKQTLDGVFVMCHDDEFGDKTLASTTWANLKNYEITKTRNSGFPSENGSVQNNGVYKSKICTLERYLEICKEYGCIALIELKYSKGIENNNTSRMQALMDVIEKAGMLDQVMFLASQYNCLKWTRENGYEYIPCQYLVNSLNSDSVLNRCIENNFDVSINVTGGYDNSEEWMAKYYEKGIRISTWTFTQYSDYNEVQKWIDKGVDYVTCDWQRMDMLKLPVKTAEDEIEYCKVVFKDYDGTVLKESKVIKGRTAAAPKVTRDGYEFVSWDKSLYDIKEDTVFTAQYEIINYEIQYNLNAYEIYETNFSSKKSFVNEFYGDLLDWFREKGNQLANVTVKDGVYTITKNGVTVSFSSVDDLLAIDLYDFEKTVSNYIYKPVKRNSDGTCVIYVDEMYFLNSSKYIEKYRDLDRWFYNCIINTELYSSYDTTYTPTSSGKIQIMFRFHQWCKGTNIPQFNNLPVKYELKAVEGLNPVMPNERLTYTINDEFVLPSASGDYQFLGWTLEPESDEYVTDIKKGSMGDIILYAQWELPN